MANLRLTLLRPHLGAEEEVHHLLKELDESLAEAPGLLFSFVLGQEHSRLGRVSLWLSKDEANREAISPRILSLRSRLRLLSVDTEEMLLRVESGHMPAGFSALIDAPTQPVVFPATLKQPALPG